MQNRLQQFHDVPVGAAGLVKLHAAAGGQGEQRLFSGAEPGFIHVPAAVDPPHGKDPVHPAFEQGGEAAPPEGKLPDHQVAVFDLFDLVFDKVCESKPFRRIHFFQLLPEAFRIFHGLVRAAPGDRIKLHPVQVADAEFVAFFPQRLTRRLKHGMVEAVRFRMTIDD